MTKPEIQAVMKILSERTIAFHPIFVDMSGSITAALFLSQLFYWTGKEASRDGWVYKTQVEWEQETRLSRYEQATARKHLLTAGLIEEKKVGTPPTIHYRIKMESISSWLANHIVATQQIDLGEPSKLNCGNPANHSAGLQQFFNTETTTETTQKTTVISADAESPTEKSSPVPEKTTSRKIGDLLTLPPEGAKRESEAARERRDQVKELWEVFRDTFITEIGDFIGTRKGVREDKSIKTILEDMGDYQRTKDYLVWFVKNWKDAPFLKRDAHPSIGAACYFRKELFPVFLSGGKFGQRKNGPVTSATADLAAMWDKFEKDYPDKFNKGSNQK